MATEEKLRARYARLEPLDPIEKVLADLGQMRGRAYTDLLRLPAPSPFIRGLQDVDKLLERLEDDIMSIHGTAVTAVLGGPAPGLPARWVAGLRARRPGG